MVVGTAEAPFEQFGAKATTEPSSYVLAFNDQHKAGGGQTLHHRFVIDVQGCFVYEAYHQALCGQVDHGIKGSIQRVNVLYVEMTSSRPARTKLVISYSHIDARWLEELQVFLKPLEREGTVDRWDDTRIKTGQRWKEQIKTALDEAKVAVLLISQEFLASDFIANDELPSILAAEKSAGLVVMPVLLSPSTFESSPLSKFQAFNKPSKTFSEMKKPDRMRAWVELVDDIKTILPESPEAPASAAAAGSLQASMRAEPPAAVSSFSPSYPPPPKIGLPEKESRPPRPTAKPPRIKERA